MLTVACDFSNKLYTRHDAGLVLFYIVCERCIFVSVACYDEGTIARIVPCQHYVSVICYDEGTIACIVPCQHYVSVDKQQQQQHQSILT